MVRRPICCPIPSFRHRPPATAIPVSSRTPVSPEPRSLAGRATPRPSAPLTPEGLRGRVVLVDFWTYTCVNWLHTLPYVRAWAAKNADAGLTVVGVHTPEFDFWPQVSERSEFAGADGR
jgi:thiol-disulfide isomerase/thioredoxin